MRAYRILTERARARLGRNASLEAFAVGKGFVPFAESDSAERLRRAARTEPIEFVACGHADDFDADASYPLTREPPRRDLV